MSKSYSPIESGVFSFFLREEKSISPPSTEIEGAISSFSELRIVTLSTHTRKGAVVNFFAFSHSFLRWSINFVNSAAFLLSVVNFR